MKVGILQTRILEWVFIPFSRESSRPRDRTLVSCIAGRFLYHLSQQGSPKYYIADKVLNGYLDQKKVYQFQKSSLFYCYNEGFLFT